MIRIKKYLFVLALSFLKYGLIAQCPLLEVLSTDNQNNLIYKKLNNYDKLGNLLSEETTNREFTTKKVYDYDANNKLTKTSKYVQNKLISSEVIDNLSKTSTVQGQNSQKNIEKSTEKSSQIATYEGEKIIQTENIEKEGDLILSKKQKNDKNEIITDIQNKYDNNKNLIETTTFDKIANITFKKTIEYNDKTITKTSDYQNNILVSYSIYEFDGKNLIKTTKFNAQNQPEYSISNVYDTKFRLIKQSSFQVNALINSKEIQYNKDDQIIEEITRNRSNQITQKTIFKYNCTK